MEDAQIIALYWERNEAAITESHQKFGEMLQRISFGILENQEDSEECVNDTYQKAWDSIPPQQPLKLAAYLGRITRNLSINRWHEGRARKRGGGMLLHELSDCIPSPACVETEVEDAFLSEVIGQWLRSLPRDDRVLFLRRYWFGNSLEDLASVCGTTPGKLAGRMFRLRKKLKSTLEKEEIGL